MQSIQRINLKHLKKCDQIWDDMEPNEKGRVCAKCQHTIIDFRNLSDKEIAETHVFTKGKVCGLYHPRQLQIERPTSRWNKLKPIYFSLMGMLSTVNLMGQEQIAKVPSEQVEKDTTKQTTLQQKKKPIQPLSEKVIIVSGSLLDEKGEVLIGANVVVQGTTRGTSTDFNGFYFLDISNEISRDGQATLEFTYTGLRTQEVVIKKEDIADKTYFEHNLSFEAVSIGISEFYVVRQPAHKRFWHKVKSVFKRKK